MADPSQEAFVTSFSDDLFNDGSFVSLAPVETEVIWTPAAFASLDIPDQRPQVSHNAIMAFNHQTPWSSAPPTNSGHGQVSADNMDVDTQQAEQNVAGSQPINGTVA